MESGEITIDTNVDNDVSNAFSTEGACCWSFYVTNDSGDTGVHKVAVQIRPDNSAERYFNIGVITGEGVFAVPGKYGGSDVRLKVTKPEGAASISKCYIFGI